MIIEVSGKLLLIKYANKIIYKKHMVQAMFEA